jgi:hypothetical protein
MPTPQDHPPKRRGRTPAELTAIGKAYIADRAAGGPPFPEWARARGLCPEYLQAKLRLMGFQTGAGRRYTAR